MPRIFEWRGYIFFFYSNEGNPREPLHVHIRKRRAISKFWIEPEVELAANHGMNARELRQLKKVVAENVDLIRNTWNEFFGE